MMQRAKHQGREKTCFVPLCRSGYRSNPDKVSMFAVPSDASRLAEWDMDATWTMVPILGNVHGHLRLLLTRSGADFCSRLRIIVPTRPDYTAHVECTLNTITTEMCESHFCRRIFNLAFLLR